MRETLSYLGLALILLGFVLVAAGSVTSSNIEAGGVVFLGPVPIPFGSSRMAITGLVIGILMMVLFYLGR